MAQADYVINPNPTGLAMRTEINQIFQAILSNNAGTAEPSTTTAGMFWGDMSNSSTFYLKIRNHANDGWVSLYAYDVATKTIQAMANGSTILSLLSSKQATLVSGTNIKTVNGDSLLGSGNIVTPTTTVNNTLTSTSTTQALSAAQGKVLQDSKQATLVSGTNIKTLNGASLLGSGDLSVSSYVSRPTKTAFNQILVGGVTLTVSSPVAGTDYFIQKISGAYSLATIKDSNTIGGFHYGLTPNGETPTGNKSSSDITLIAGINAYSIWTNTYRPTCSPEGMFEVNGRWYDIYPMDSEYAIRKYSAPTAVTGKYIAGGAASYGRVVPKIPLLYGGDGSSNYGKFTWFQANEVAKACGKTLIDYNEFGSIAYGVLEGTDSSSYDSGGGSIFHIPSLTSKFGMEMATGTQWIWGKNLANYPTDATWSWRSNADGRGQIYSTENSPTAVVLGGDRVDGSYGSYAGSRSSRWIDYVWTSGWHIGCRFACDHMNLV